MQRIYYPMFVDGCGSTTSNTTVGVLQIANGGTNASDAVTAAANLHLLTSAELNTTNGAIGLDGAGTYSGPFANLWSWNLTGPTHLAINASSSYTISDYDSFTSYTVTAVTGTVTQVDPGTHTLTYTAPAGAGTSGFIINGATKNITITAT